MEVVLNDLQILHMVAQLYQVILLILIEHQNERTVQPQFQSHPSHITHLAHVRLVDSHLHLNVDWVHDVRVVVLEVTLHLRRIHASRRSVQSHAKLAQLNQFELGLWVRVELVLPIRVSSADCQLVEFHLEYCLVPKQ